VKAKRNIAQRLLDRFFYKFYARNLLYELQLRARSEAADFVQAEMPEAQIFSAHRDIILFAIKNSAPDGLFLEFGVATGNTMGEIASGVPNGKTVYGFDSFEGLPDDWSGHVETTGAFKQKGLPKVPQNATLIPGLFDDTLPPFMEQNAGPVSFVHIDCDLYSSTVTILENIGSRFQPGTMILFDEYFNYPSWKLHEHKAWMEFCEKSGTQFTYIGFTALDGRVLVRID
tara:strand:+ start:28356 stop:29042 length:687 start_codon:yes stop_codon:yes gene_type:complete